MYSLLAQLVVVAALSVIPHETCLEDSVDYVELNHFYDGLGVRAFSQLIFWDWYPHERKYHVIAWTLYEGDVHSIPWGSPGKYVMCWWHGGRLRRITAVSYVETWTQVDSESIDQETFPKEFRRGLRHQIPFRGIYKR